MMIGAPGLPGGDFCAAGRPWIETSLVRIFVGAILTIDGLIWNNPHILTPRWRLTVTLDRPEAGQRPTFVRQLDSRE